MLPKRPQDLPWVNDTIRKLIRKRNRFYRKYKKSKTVQIDRQKLQKRYGTT